MTERLDILARQAQEQHAYSHAIDAIARTLDSVTHQPSRSLESQPARTLDNTDEAHDAAALALLRNLDIRLPTRGPDANDTAETLRSVLADRQSNVAKLRASTQRSVEESLARTLKAADGDLQCLTGALYAYTPFATPHLADMEVEGRLADLGTRTAGVAKEVGGLDGGRIADEARAKLSALLVDGEGR